MLQGTTDTRKTRWSIKDRDDENERVGNSLKGKRAQDIIIEKLQIISIAPKKSSYIQYIKLMYKVNTALSCLITYLVYNSYII